VFTLCLKDLAASKGRLTVAVAVLFRENEPWMTVTLLRQDNKNPRVVFYGESRKMICSWKSIGWTFANSMTGLTRTAQHGNTAFRPPLDIAEIHE
jgi:hypothetical protein